MKKYFLKNKWHFLIYTAFIIGCMFCFTKSRVIANEADAPDLLTRVIGSRLMQHNKTIYFYKWHPGEPAAYFNFNKCSEQIVKGITVTPSMLWLLQPVAFNNFCTAKDVWFCIEFIFLFLAGLLTLIQLKGLSEKLVALACFFFFFATSQNWYVHIEAGQVYIVYAFIFALLYSLQKSNNKNKLLLQGALIVFAAWLRPFFILLTLPYLFKRKVNFIKGSLVSGVAIILITTLLSHWGYWQEYRAAMNEYSKEVINKMTPADPSFKEAYPVTTIDCVYPVKHEAKHGAGALYSLQKYLQDFGLVTSNIFLFISITLLACAIITIITSANSLTNEQLIVKLFLLYLTGELCAPAVRYPYNFVQWLVPALIVITGFKSNYLASACMVLGLLFNQQIPFYFKYEREIGEILMIMASMVYVIRKHPVAVLLYNSLFSSVLMLFSSITSWYSLLSISFLLAFVHSVLAIQIRHWSVTYFCTV